MKKLVFISVIFAVLIMLTACGGDDVPNQEVDWEWEQEQANDYNPNYSKEGKDKPLIDYASYDDYGEWSRDRMWVHKTEESWDAVKSYYGYIDLEGNLVGEWHEEKTNDNSFEYEEFIDYNLSTAPWLIPGDFQGKYAVILCGRYGSTASGSYVEVIDIQGNSIARFAPYFGTYSYKTDELMLNDFAEKLSNGVLFWDRDMFEVSMSWIENGQFYEKELEGNFMSALDIQEKTNGYYPYWYYNSNSNRSNFGLIAENGDNVFENKIDYEVTKLVPSAEAETVSVYFIGVDEREYVVEMDFDGNWLTEPTIAR